MKEPHQRLIVNQRLSMTTPSINFCAEVASYKRASSDLVTSSPPEYDYNVYFAPKYPQQYSYWITHHLVCKLKAFDPWSAVENVKELVKTDSSRLLGLRCVHNNSFEPFDDIEGSWYAWPTVSVGVN